MIQKRAPQNSATSATNWLQEGELELLSMSGRRISKQAIARFVIPTKSSN